MSCGGYRRKLSEGSIRHLPMKLTRFQFSPPNAFRFGGGGGGFSVGHFLDPLGITPVGKGKGGGAKNFWDPANVFTGSGPSAASSKPQDPAAPIPTPPATPSSAAVIDVQQSTRREALRRRGISSTVYAGATGGWFAPTAGGSIGMVPPVGAFPLANPSGKK